MKRTRMLAMGLSLAAVTAVSLSTTQASAAPNASWLGACSTQHGDDWGGGWCDGNGPQWQYQGSVDCTNGHYYFGPTHWAGDRSGSYGHCPVNTFAVSWDVVAFYAG